ncbi:MAG: hypothetical protein OXE44_15745 [Nitrospinae bacterium]|nr:hypothetical protein [Nitrospinota bacterium]
MSYPLPREVSPGVFWLGDCLVQHSQGKIYHSYNAAFLIIGSEASMLVETGHPKDFPIIEGQMRDILAKGGGPLKHLFLTHQETPHSGGLGRVLDRYPDLTIHGDMCDYHLAFPQHEGRFKEMRVGDAIDLGNTQFMAVEPVIRDLRSSLWGFETKGRVLFPGDGFAYSHYHTDGHCGMFAEEATSLDLVDVLGVFAERALFWTTFTDMNIYADKLEELMAELNVEIVAPTHGLPIRDIAQTMPKVREGLVRGD